MKHFTSARMDGDNPSNSTPGGGLIEMFKRTKNAQNSNFSSNFPQIFKCGGGRRVKFQIHFKLVAAQVQVLLGF